MLVENLELTASQEELLTKMEAFLNSSERFFLLTGKPGVGKTTITKVVLAEHIAADRMEVSKFRMNVAGITLAHQAKNVLGAFIPNVFTFAKAYGLKEVIDENSGKRSFEYDKYNDHIVGQQPIPVFVHDEVSMYTPQMLDYIFDKTQMFSKIIFIGDRAQLPPVDPEGRMPRDGDSPIFSYDIPESCKHELTERVRQAEGNPILELSDIIRDEIFGLQRVNVVTDAIATPKIIDGIGYGLVKYEEFLAHYRDRNPLETRLLAFKNSCINKFNPVIRNHLLNDPAEILVEGDIVTMTENFYKMNEMGYPDYVLYNSDTFKLGQMYTRVEKFFTEKKTYKIDCYVAKIEDREGEFFITPTAEGKVKFDKSLSELASFCKKKQVPWDKFWEFKKMFCEYTYGYASTVYKAQGSTYETIYVDINDILNTKPLTRKRQLQTIYTAITRAKNDVYFLV